MTQSTGIFPLGDDPSFRALFTEIPCACMMHRMIFDERGNSVDYVPLEPNPGFARVLGFDPAQIIGKRASEYLPEAEARHWASVFAPAAIDGIKVSVTVYSPRKKQTYRVTAISPARGFFLTMYSVAGKHSERALESEWKWVNGSMSARDFVKMIFTTMPCAGAIQRIDRDEAGNSIDYTIVDVNEIFCEFLNTTPNAMIGKNARSRLARAEFDHWLSVFAPIAFGQANAREISLILPNRVMCHGVAVSLEPGYVAVLFTN